MIIKTKHLFIIFITLLLLSCGTSNFFKPVIGEIKNLTMINNTLSFETADSTFVNLTFGNVKAWSAGNKSINHNYLLPLESGQKYNILVEIISNDVIVAQTVLKDYICENPTGDFLRVHFIDVAQGDAILIQTPDQKTIQIDGGYGTISNEDWAGGGVPMALNYLKRKNISSLDFIIETHYHADHYGGLNDIKKNNSGILWNNYISNTENKLGLHTGSTIAVNSCVTFEVFNFGFPTIDTSNNKNNESIVIKATYQDAERQ